MDMMASAVVEWVSSFTTRSRRRKVVPSPMSETACPIQIWR